MSRTPFQRDRQRERGAGRNREIELVNGKRAPVARDSIERLTRPQFLRA